MKYVAAALFAFVLLGSCSQGAGFLSPRDYDPARVLPPPPADGSPAAKAELAELHAIEAVRTAAEFDKAMADEKDESITAFAQVMGTSFDPAKLPATAKLFADVRVEEKAAATLAKNYFQRTRPWIADPSLQPCAKGDAPKSAYPSGHATMGYAMAIILTELAPEKAPAIMARAAEYAENRLVCGMHYRRDIVAGEALGTLVAEELLRTPAFRAELEAARVELRTAHVIAPAP
jgi:acid phosphatase (class A)